MKALRVLHMSNTSRTLDNIPPTLDDLDNLQVHFNFLIMLSITLRKRCATSFISPVWGSGASNTTEFV